MDQTPGMETNRQRPGRIFKIVMKSTLSPSPKIKTRGVEFPCLMHYSKFIGTNHYYVVLFTHRRKGTIVYLSEDYKGGWMLGEYYDYWDSTNMEMIPDDHIINLQN